MLGWLKILVKLIKWNQFRINIHLSFKYEFPYGQITDIILYSVFYLEYKLFIISEIFSSIPSNILSLPRYKFSFMP